MKVTLKNQAKRGGKYSTRLLKRVKKFFIKLNIENLFDESFLNRHSRYILEEMLFLAKKELDKSTPDGKGFYVKISKLPLKQSMTCHPHLGNKLSFGNVNSNTYATEVIGSLSVPSKMPTYGYSLPAIQCKKGSELKNKSGSTCESCYGFKGWYRISWVRYAMEKRSIAIHHKDWVDAMTFSIKYHALTEFRWHDTGDLQSLDHLRKIIDIAINTPEVTHWLPTQEHEIVEEFWKQAGEVPLSKLIPNLKIRLSAEMINEAPPIHLAIKLGVLTSMVADDNSENKFNCPSSLQNNQCKDCRKCWSDDFCVIYRKH